jgi:ligand-binding SRPBCC domain-containing protein
MKIYFETKINLPYLTVKAGFDRDLFLSLTPPGAKVELRRFDGCRKGDEVHLALDLLLTKQSWISLITEDNQDEKEWSFVDEGKILPWPLAKWRHHHRVVSLDERSCKIIDDISFDCLWPWMNAMVFPVLWSTFAIRPRRYKKFFQG